jgi:hypothetical protein
MKPVKSLFALSAGLILATIAGSAPTQAQGTLPNPILYLTSTEVYTTAGGTFVRHRYDVLNKDQYPAAMFAPAPSLPPCGRNANSSRTWVDFFENRTDRRIYGFCALGSPNDLGSIWFATPEGTVPPSYIYIVIHDRQTDTRYRSNLADTTL